MLERFAPAIPLADPAADNADEREAILSAVSQVVARGSYILGPEVTRFEARMAERLRVPGAVGVGSGTDALVLAMLAVEIGHGDEVVTVSHTAGPTVAAIRILGATPVLVEVAQDTYCIDPTNLEQAIGPRTKAIIAVHLYGHPADMDAVCEIAHRHNLAVVEDCAQAQDAAIDGRPVGSIGTMGCFSFYPTKNLGAIGDGGLVSSRVPGLAERVRRLRTYGWTKAQYAEIVDGRCSRLDELQAAILNVKLEKLTAAIERRCTLAHRYSEAFRDLPLVCPRERPGCRHAYHLYVIRCDRRDDLARHLNGIGISTGLHYPYPVHAQPAFCDVVRLAEPLKATELLAREILTLPLFPGMKSDQQERVIDAVRRFYGRS
jgi:dTDP-4-amino-4,6-dideoxygalactose transaminase